MAKKIRKPHTGLVVCFWIIGSAWMLWLLYCIKHPTGESLLTAIFGKP